MIYYIYSAFDWFNSDAPDDYTILASCALLGDYLGIIDDGQTLIKPPFSGERWYNKTLKINKAKLIDSVSNQNIQNCLLNFSPLRENSSLMSQLIVSEAHELAKGLY